uniref:Prostaglandin I2 receptor n=1 Tax=Callorhinchus milii TaxID=7868 RepID=A0A4W3IT95_CALMI
MNISTCENITEINTENQPLVSILMFTAGMVGNVLALVILGVHRREHRTKSSVFCILVTGLAITDLLGTCFLSPVVFIAYAKDASLIGLTGNHALCDFFALVMIFFSLASMLILFAMSVERCLAISHPYFYSKHVGRTFAKVVLPVIYAFCTAFCLLPVMGFGELKQYCPGTWCFVKMESKQPLVVSFSLLYATLMALLILAVLACNGSVIVSLCKMHKSQRNRRGSVLSSHRRRKSWFGQREEEIDHLILLALMTTIFAICSVPLTILLYNIAFKALHGLAPPYLRDLLTPYQPIHSLCSAGSGLLQVCLVPTSVSLPPSFGTPSLHLAPSLASFKTFLFDQLHLRPKVLQSGIWTRAGGWHQEGGGWGGLA